MVLISIHFFYLNGKKLIKNQNLYRLEKVFFVGVEKSDPYEVIEALGLEKGMNLLFVDIDKLNQKIKTIPRYESAEVVLQYPNTMILKLKEKKPKFIIKMGAQLYSVNKWGEITERTNEIKEYDLFVIDAQGFENIAQLLTHKKYLDFITYSRKVPENEQDIFNVFSGISLNWESKDWILYGHKKNTSINLGKQLTLNKLRKTRYAFIYANEKQLSTKNMVISDDLVYFNP